MEIPVQCFRVSCNPNICFGLQHSWFSWGGMGLFVYTTVNVCLHRQSLGIREKYFPLFSVAGVPQPFVFHLSFFFSVCLLKKSAEWKAGNDNFHSLPSFLLNFFLFCTMSLQFLPGFLFLKTLGWHHQRILTVFAQINPFKAGAPGKCPPCSHSGLLLFRDPFRALAEIQIPPQLFYFFGKLDWK